MSSQGVPGAVLSCTEATVVNRMCVNLLLREKQWQKDGHRAVSPELCDEGRCKALRNPQEPLVAWGWVEPLAGAGVGGRAVGSTGGMRGGAAPWLPFPC